ncbi:MAG TPA: alanine racemase, partial [Burkholderiales bacterium]|nr:alanine racemase [Burkholderiales bacterium]
MNLPGLDHASALLTIDLGAIRENYLRLRERLGGTACAAVVKADAYGLGASRVARTLAGVGCQHFFVAHLNEAIALRPQLPATAQLYVLHGSPVGAEREFLHQRVIPVLNSLPQVEAWAALAEAKGVRLPALLQVDTGMSRLGLSGEELAAVAADPGRLQGIELRYVMSHLACAEQQEHPMNPRQLAAFREARRLLPPAPASFANSSGIFLGPAYHFDLARPGAALFGLAPVAGRPNPLRPVIRLQGKVIQTRFIPAGAGVGYGVTYRAATPRRIATVSVGYADGFPRSLGNRAVAYFGATPLPLVGNVSMDTITLDASAVPEGALAPGSLVDLIGEHCPVDEAARQAGTLGYEFLTRLG